MSDILKKFINEELVWNYKMRGPKTNNQGDVRAEIEDVRSSTFDSAKTDFAAGIEKLNHDITVATDKTELEDIFGRWGIDAYDIVHDTTEFDRAADEENLEEMKRMIMQGLGKWVKEKTEGLAGDGFNYASLQDLVYKG
jgi:hypothetical protein